MNLPPQIMLLTPLLDMAFSASYIPITIFRLLTTSPSKLLSWSSFQKAWFSNFWSWFGSMMRTNAATVVAPLIRSHASGVILDIGPGSGEWVYLYSSTVNKVIKIYGVEPNLEHHVALRKAVEAAGLQDIYEILPVGAEDLGHVGLGDESVDTIVTVQTLCSCPNPQGIVGSLYPMLKKGGTWVVYEHVRTKYRDEFVGYFWQPFVNLIWPIFFGGCDITRPTDQWLRDVGDWKEVSLRAGEGEGPYNTIPHSLGTLVKKK
ncbi:S-adenosyl-L-methionine-dependent methyltransferase [Aureobasidium sp. EXF-8845]|nr:S-adenosyl-L-methionine-dependent methyltransferase [Aureobasidium sp. EXF-8845]KAI4855721.1 S-adenosyl-L-methionine-dependent methyltransferase [Aureobasidium sp. EXF-8846]